MSAVRLHEEASVTLDELDSAVAPVVSDVFTATANLIVETTVETDDSPVIVLFNLKEFGDYNDFMTKLDGAKIGSVLIDLVERLPTTSASTGKALTYNRIITVLNREGKLGSIEFPPKYSGYNKTKKHSLQQCILILGYSLQDLELT
jgi:hypothetical protein